MAPSSSSRSNNSKRSDTFCVQTFNASGHRIKTKKPAWRPILALPPQVNDRPTLGQPTTSYRVTQFSLEPNGRIATGTSVVEVTGLSKQPERGQQHPYITQSEPEHGQNGFEDGPLDMPSDNEGCMEGLGDTDDHSMTGVHPKRKRAPGVSAF
jgi:hypothetical protein